MSRSVVAAADRVSDPGARVGRLRADKTNRPPARPIHALGRGVNPESVRILALAFAIAAMLLALPAQADPAARRCTLVGTAGEDALLGTPGRDVICSLGGNDIVDGAGGDDVIYGGPGRDRLEGGPGRDAVAGGSGDDVLFAWDGRADRLDGGVGRDRAWIDRSLDTVRRIERLG